MVGFIRPFLVFGPSSHSNAEYYICTKITKILIMMKDRCTFECVAGLWAREKRMYVKRSTYAAYSLILTNHLVPAFGRMTDIKEEDVQDFVFERLGAGRSQKTVKDMLVVLKMVIRYAAKHEYMQERQIKVHFPTERERSELPVLCRADQKRLMKYVTDNFSFRNLGIFICLNAGLRIGELCALKWENLDVCREVIVVDKTIQRIYFAEGGCRWTELRIDTPKSANSMREIPMTKELLKIVKPLRKIVNPSCFVLTNSMSPTEPRTYRNYYNKLVGEIGIPPLKFHGLRHSFATRCIEGKCDYKTVSVLLGHSNISTTLNLYVHPDINQKKRCVEQMYRSLK